MSSINFCGFQAEGLGVSVYGIRCTSDTTGERQYSNMAVGLSMLRNENTSRS